MGNPRDLDLIHELFNELHQKLQGNSFSQRDPLSKIASRVDELHHEYTDAVESPRLPIEVEMDGMDGIRRIPGTPRHS